MEWQPIETYDKLKVKPRYAVFYFEATGGRNPRDETMQFTRSYGSRNCTHWINLPNPPICPFVHP